MIKTYSKIKTQNLDDLKPLPKFDFINAIQFQLFDNGEKPGRGKSQHVLTLEVYCEGRLDLMKPYWKRAVPLLDEKTFMTWVDKALSEGKITQNQHEVYKLYHGIIVDRSKDPDIEFAKLGHVGNKRKNEYYPGQFVAVIKTKGGGLQVFVLNGDDGVETDSFIFDQHWRKGSPRRKFFGLYDPYRLYAAAQAEKRRAAEVEGRRHAAIGQVIA